MEKELRTIPRSMPLLFAMGAPLLTVLVISTLFRNGALGGRPFQLAFPLCVCYALLGFTQLIFNNLGAEGTGIQMLFLSPTPIRTVLLAKNLLHGMLYAVGGISCGSSGDASTGRTGFDACLRRPRRGYCLRCPTNLAAGNLLSLTMPYRVNLGRISRQRGSQASALVSMLIQVIVMGCGAGGTRALHLLRQEMAGCAVSSGTGGGGPGGVDARAAQGRCPRKSQPGKPDRHAGEDGVGHFCGQIERSQKHLVLALDALESEWLATFLAGNLNWIRGFWRISCQPD